MKRVLVTGSEGFIGSHLVERLVREGYKVRALCQYNSFSSIGWLRDLPKDIFDGVEVAFSDVRDYESVTKYMSGVDIVYHAAALIAIPYSYIAPKEYINTNIVGTANVVLAARDQGVSKVVHFSTSEVYGTAEYVPIDEKHQLCGQSPYSASKIGADQFALSIHRSFDLPVTVARPFNTFGPRQSLRAVIPTIILQALTRKTIFLGNTGATRDFSYVADIVDALVLMAKFPQIGNGEIFNIASNFEISISETVSLICKLTGADLKLELDEQRLRPTNSEVERLWGDCTKFQSAYGWQPTARHPRKHFEESLESTIEWFETNRYRSDYRDDGYKI